MIEESEARRSSYDDMNYEKDGLENEGSLSPFTFICFLLVTSLLGLTLQYSASYPASTRMGLEHYSLLLITVISSLIGIAIGLTLRYISDKNVYRTSFFLVPFSVLLAVLEGLGYFKSTGIASSMLLFSYCLFLPNMLDKDRRTVKIITVAILLLIMLVSGGIACMMIGVIVTLLMLSSIRASKLAYLYLVFSAILLSIFAIFIIPDVSSSFFRSVMPVEDSALFDDGLMKTRQAIRDGGLFGVGLGRGLFKLGVVFDIESAYILVNILEETGVLGLLVILFLFSILFFLGYRSAQRSIDAGDDKGSLITISLSFVIFLKLVFYILHMLSLFPSENLMMPFFSYAPVEQAINMATMIVVYRFIHSTGRPEHVKLK